MSSNTPQSCPKCSCTEFTKAGMLYGKPRKKCKNCGCKYTSEKKEWKPTPLMFLVVILFLSKMSMRAIARMIKVSPQTIVNWITKFYDKHKDDFPDVSDVREIAHFNIKCNTILKH